MSEIEPARSSFTLFFLVLSLKTKCKRIAAVVLVCKSMVELDTAYHIPRGTHDEENIKQLPAVTGRGKYGLIITMTFTKSIRREDQIVSLYDPTHEQLLSDPNTKVGR